MAFNVTAWFRSHPVVASAIYGVGSALVTALTPDASSSAVIGAAVFVINLIDAHITQTTAAAVAAATPASQQTPGPRSPASTPAVPSFVLSVDNANPRIGDSVTISLSGGTPQGNFKLYQAGLPISNAGALTQTLPLDSKGSFSSSFSLTGASTLANVIIANGSVSFYAVDSAGNVSNTITLS